MLKKIFGLLFAFMSYVPTSYGTEPKVKVFIERDGKLYEVLNSESILEILENSEVEEVEPEDLDENEMAGVITESQEGGLEIL